MQLNILCTPEFTKREHASLLRAVSASGMTTEKFIRRAVRLYCRACVPTHSRTRKAEGKTA